MIGETHPTTPKMPPLSQTTIHSLTAAREDMVGHARWDSEEVRQGAIFYAGNRVFLNPNLKIGNPDALTPDASLKVPTTRAAKTELYKQNMKSAALREARSKMTKKEREEEQSRAEKALTRFVKADTSKKARLPAVEAPRKPVGLISILDSMIEDESAWEQHTQGGCTFWQNIVTREIRVDNLMLKGKNQCLSKEYGRKKYPTGTGAPLFDKTEYEGDRNWLISKGMPLPAIKTKKDYSDEVAQNAAALYIQMFFRRRKYRKKQLNNSHVNEEEEEEYYEDERGNEQPEEDKEAGDESRHTKQEGQLENNRIEEGKLDENDSESEYEDYEDDEEEYSDS